MNHIFNLLFEQYAGYNTIDIVLEIVAVIFGVLSVLFSKQNKIWVFPTGIISTAIFVYLLYKWSLLGDMMINVYYFIMSIYGWYIWTRKVDNEHYTPITYTTNREKYVSGIIFCITLAFVYFVYIGFNKWTSWTAYVDTLTTAIFFVGTWLMAKRKVENWIFWIVGDLISIPLYFYKGLTFTSMQYIGFTVLAVYGFLAVEKYYKQEPSSCLKVVLFGPESTGKTTLSKQLAKHYNTVWVKEFARNYLQKKWDAQGKTCEPKDLLPIAKGQMALENNNAKKANKVLICDTDLLETKVYSEAYYSGTCDPILEKYALENTYDIYFLTYIDIPWEKDDLRDKPKERYAMFEAFENALKKYNKHYVVLKGDNAERLKTAITYIDKLIAKR